MELSDYQPNSLVVSQTRAVSADTDNSLFSAKQVDINAEN